MVLTKSNREEIESVVEVAVDKLLRSESSINQIANLLFAKISTLYEEKLKTLDYKVQTLEKENAILCTKIDDLEQYSRRKNLRIYGVPEEKGEDTTKKVLDICKNVLKLDTSVHDIDRCHRIRTKSPKKENSKKPPAILVKFVRYNTRRLVFNNKKMLKGNKFYFIKEDLTKTRLEILTAANEIFGFKNVFTLDGTIYVYKEGRRHSIRSVADLDKLS